MGVTSKRNIFVQNGKRLRIPLCEIIYKERVSTIFEGSAATRAKSYSGLTERLRGFKINRNKLNVSLLAVPSGLIFAALIFFMFVKTSGNNDGIGKYSIFSSRPLTLLEATQDVDYMDSRAQKINEIFKAYRCPLEGLGDVFVREADKRDIPWYLAAAVAFQESSCGKNTPKVEGEESYNAWGWNVYGGTVHTFDNWVRGIETVSSYLAKNFFSKGITDTCDIMKTYTPSSNGSWCFGVNIFAEKIKNYQTP